MLIFKDREAAGQVLTEHLKKYKEAQYTIVLGIPRGGVVVAAVVAKKLNLPLDVVITRKIGAPDQPELALGAVDPSGQVWWDKSLLGDLRIRIYDLRFEIKKQLEEIKRRENLYRLGKPPLNVKSRTVILVDDGIATGATVISAATYLKSIGTEKIVLAVPVGPVEVLEKLKGEVDELVVPYPQDYLGSVGSFYQNFEPVSDEKVIKLLSFSFS